MNDRNVMRAMINYGGSFVRALGEAAQCADEENLDRIKLTWPDYWKQYTEVAQCFIIDAAKRKEIKMRLQIHIDMNNDAFSGSRLAWQAEAARILRDAASRVNDGQFKNGFNLKDFNGNSVGMLVVIPEATP